MLRHVVKAELRAVAVAAAERRIGRSLELHARVKRELRLHEMADHAEGWAKGLDGDVRAFSSRSYSEQACGKRDAGRERATGACASGSGSGSEKLT